MDWFVSADAGCLIANGANKLVRYISLSWVYAVSVLDSAESSLVSK